MQMWLHHAVPLFLKYVSNKNVTIGGRSVCDLYLWCTRKAIVDLPLSLFDLHTWGAKKRSAR